MTGATIVALAASVPWVVGPPLILWRARHTRSLDEEVSSPPEPAPLVSVIIPARDERHNIERCVRSVLGTTWPRLEVLVVDDHSGDGTGDLARAIAATDPRLRVLANPDLPDGWFGKQWACTTGASASRGEILLFTDADTTHAPDLIVRAVNAMDARDVDLLSVFGEQQLVTFWERVLQPMVFIMMVGRFGGTESINRSPRVRDKIANGQCIFVRREAYLALGGHEAVKHKVAEDLAMAQRFFAEGRRTALVAGLEQLSTRMYTSFAEIVAGWRKNLFVSGMELFPPTAAARVLTALLLLVWPFLALGPVLSLALGLAGVLPAGFTVWGGVTFAANLIWWAVIYRLLGMSPLWSLAIPAGGAALLAIVVPAVLQGRSVSWKGRTYRSHA